MSTSPGEFNVQYSRRFKPPNITTPVRVSRVGSPPITPSSRLSNYQLPTTPVSRRRHHDCSDVSITPGFYQRFSHRFDLRSPVPMTPIRVPKQRSPAPIRDNRRRSPHTPIKASKVAQQNIPVNLHGIRAPPNTPVSESTGNPPTTPVMGPRLRQTPATPIRVSSLYHQTNKPDKEFQESRRPSPSVLPILSSPRRNIQSCWNSGISSPFRQQLSSSSPSSVSFHQSIQVSCSIKTPKVITFGQSFYNNVPPMINPCMQEHNRRLKKENGYIYFQPFSYAVHGQYNYYLKSCQHHQSLAGIKYVYSLLGFKFHIYSISLPNYDGQGFRLDFCTRKQEYAKGSFELTQMHPGGKITASVYHYGMEKTLNMNIYLGPQMKSCEPFQDERGKERMCVLIYT